MEFLTDQAQLILLRLFQGLGLFPVGAGVLHIGVEHQAEEIVAQIVVFASDYPGAAAGLEIGQASAGDA